MDNILEMSNMTQEHRNIMSNIEFIIKSIVKGSKFRVYREAKYDWIMYGEQTKREPDISIIEGAPIRKGNCYTNIPRFIAEILSDSTESIDRNEKMSIYAKIGVSEYWIVDWRIPGGKIERYLLNDDNESYYKYDEIYGNNDPDRNIYLVTLQNIKFSFKDIMFEVIED